MRHVDHHKQHDSYVLLFYDGPCVFILLAVFDKLDQRVLRGGIIYMIFKCGHKTTEKHVNNSSTILAHRERNEALHIAEFSAMLVYRQLQLEPAY